MYNNDTEDMLNAILKNQRIIFNQNRELFYANVFHDTIKGSEWLPDDFPVSPGGGALGYPALYILYRILNEFKPKKILEMGLGQSTKLISQYNNIYSDCNHWVVEHDSSWIEFFSNHFQLPQTTNIVMLPIKNISIDVEGQLANVTAYVGFADRFSNQTFDFICIDGPFGYSSTHFARIDLIGILPECLEDSFVILLDDCNRVGELNTFKLISQILNEHGIENYSNMYVGEKAVGLIVSKDLSFLCKMVPPTFDYYM